MIFAEDPTYHQLENKAKRLNLQKFLEPIGKGTLKMKCYKEFTELVGETKRSWTTI